MKSRRLWSGLAWALAALAALLFWLVPERLSFNGWLVALVVVTGLEVLVASRLSRNREKEFASQFERELIVLVFVTWAAVASLIVFVVVLALNRT